MKSWTRTRRSGFTLIELLIVIAIIGIIAAVLIPNMLEALQKSRQKRTMANLREFGLGMAQYWSENGGAGAAGAVTVDVADWAGTASLDEIEEAVVPDYMPQLPDEDGWGNDLEYRVQLTNPPRSFYALARSPGSDGEFAGDSYESGSFSATDYTEDIVWADGGFVRAPSPANTAGT